MNLKETADQYSNVHLFYKELYNNVVKLAQENPEFQYKTSAFDQACVCKYDSPPFVVATQKPCGPVSNGCIIGQALQAMGWNNKSELACVMPVGMLFFTNGIKDYPRCFSVIQGLQDMGNSWGECIVLYDGI